jgi:aminoglycoside phosphotransferase (APT) family kinase protein
VHALRIVSGDVVHSVVLKRFVNEAADESKDRAEREAELLLRVEGNWLPTPRLLACSHPEETDGHSALVMTRVPGEVNLIPKEPSRWIRQIANTLARIHALQLDALVSLPWTDSPTFDAPAGSKHSEAWRDARALLASPAPETTSFIHGDYQHFNLLWSQEVLTGIVDWTLGGIGHPDRDVGHCRLNLAVLFSPDWAKAFLSAYEAEAGRTVEPWWDIYEITRYSEEWPRTIPIQVANRVHVDARGMDGRVERLLLDALP